MASPAPSAAAGQHPEAIPDNVRSQVLTLISNNRQQPQQIFLFIDSTVTNDMTPDQILRFKALCYAFYDSSVSLPLARSLFRHLVSSMITLHDNHFMQLANFFMTIHQLPANNARSFALEFALIFIRQRMSVIYEQRGHHFQAATILSNIPFEALGENDTPQSSSSNSASSPSTSRLTGPIMNNNDSTSVFAISVRIAHLFIAARNVERAEYFHSRATTHMNTFKGDDSIKLQHRICHAKILDLKCKFEDAAHKYYILANESQTHQYLLDSMTDDHNASTSTNNQNHVISALIHAITCSILAPAGPRRSRLLAILYNDERSKKLDIFPLLQSIHMGRLLRKDQIDKLRPTLQPHQLTPHPDGDTVLDHAVLEHNMLAISRMYNNIGLSHLAKLLNVSSEKAEKTARVMINEKRMTASIDQVEHIIQFTKPSPTAKIEQWDSLIASLCGQVDDCVEAIVQKFPQFATHL